MSIKITEVIGLRELTAQRFWVGNFLDFHLSQFERRLSPLRSIKGLIGMINELAHGFRNGNALVFGNLQKLPFMVRVQADF